MTLGYFLTERIVRGRLIVRPMSEKSFREMLGEPMPAREAAAMLVEAAQAMRDSIGRGEARNEVAKLLGRQIADGLARMNPEDPVFDKIARALSVLEEYIGEEGKAGVAYWIGILAWSGLAA